jgi:hypothetical protein
MELRILSIDGFTSWPCRSAAYCKQLVKRNNQRRVTALREERNKHPIIWTVEQKFQIRALRLCVQQFPLLPLISDTNPGGQHVSPQGTPCPSFHFFNCAPYRIIYQTELVNQIHNPFLLGQISRDVLLSTDLYLVSKGVKDWSYTSTPHGQMKTLKNTDRSIWCR